MSKSVANSGHYFQFSKIKDVPFKDTVPHCIVETTGREFEVEVSFILGHLKWILSKLPNYFQ